jgi:hypothetical protein
MRAFLTAFRRWSIFGGQLSRTTEDWLMEVADAVSIRVCFLTDG